jgi:hypothetical protein
MKVKFLAKDRFIGAVAAAKGSVKHPRPNSYVILQRKSKASESEM